MVRKLNRSAKVRINDSPVYCAFGIEPVYPHPQVLSTLVGRLWENNHLNANTEARIMINSRLINPIIEIVVIIGISIGSPINAVGNVVVTILNREVK